MLLLWVLKRNWRTSKMRIKRKTFKTLVQKTLFCKLLIWIYINFAWTTELLTAVVPYYSASSIFANYHSFYRRLNILKTIVSRFSFSLPLLFSFSILIRVLMFVFAFSFCFQFQWMDWSMEILEIVHCSTLLYSLTQNKGSDTHPIVLKVTVRLG